MSTNALKTVNDLDLCNRWNGNEHLIILFRADKIDQFRHIKVSLRLFTRLDCFTIPEVDLIIFHVHLALFSFCSSLET